MKKEKEWLKEQVAHEQNDGLYFRENYSQYDYFVNVEDLLPLIDQLDEPEIEENFYTFDNAKKWLQDNGFVVFEKDKLDEEVQRMIDETYEATNEKPVIPQFVAEWIEEAKCNKLTLFGAMNESPREVDYWFIESDSTNQDLFARAWLDGYEVEKEQKYQVIIRDDEYIRLFLSKHEGNVTIGTNDNYIEKCPEVTYLTEQEIKDYDERFWAFAQEVME